MVDNLTMLPVPDLLNLQTCQLLLKVKSEAYCLQLQLFRPWCFATEICLANSLHVFK